MLTRGIASLIFAAAATLVSTDAFSVVQPARRRDGSAAVLFQAADAWSSSAASGGGAGSIERIEFKIYPDGRVEETVRGVKGNNCHKARSDHAGFSAACCLVLYDPAKRIPTHTALVSVRVSECYRR